MTAITNYHKLGGLKQQKFILSESRRLEVQNQGVGRAALPPKALEGKLFYLFQLLMVPGKDSLAVVA